MILPFVILALLLKVFPTWPGSGEREAARA